jgi:hypothetical protein
MALRARLVAPPPPPRLAWPWHTPKCGSVRASALLLGDRRIEAETYLSSGFGIRTAIESKVAGWTLFGKLAKVSMPNRLKGILVSPEYGNPYLAATQVFDARPVPRKFLALQKMDGAPAYFVDDGMILVTRSGSVGRPIVAYSAHRGIVISDDLLRVKAIDPRNEGWIYACLLTPQSRAMCTGAHYGHIIKHLEISHLEALPFPTVNDDTIADFALRVARIIKLRNEGHRLTLEAEARFETALGMPKISDWGEKGFSIKASKTFVSGRRRFDATIHNPGVSAIRRHLAKHGQGFTAIAEAGYDVWLPTRFRRVPAEDGVLLVDSADLTEINPDLTKRIADSDFGDPYRGRVEAGWVLMARSGQIYGIIGTTVLAEQDLSDKVISDDVIRLKPHDNATIKAGYLMTALSHPILGRPVVKSLTYGSSIPHIEVADIEAHQIVRLDPSDECAIAELAEASAKARATADILEREIAADASAIIDRFLAAV